MNIFNNFSKIRPNRQILSVYMRQASFKDFFKGGQNKTEEVDLNQNSPFDKEEDLVSKQSDLIKTTRLTRVKAYKPPTNIEAKVKSLAKEVFGDEFNEKNYTQISLSDPVYKFHLLTKCIKEFNHNITNTALNEIKKVDDLITYYSIEQKDTSTLEDIQQMPDLPPNLHINLEYNRFDPASDTFFAGKDAFPKRDTIVTSLWYSKKYKSVNKKKDYFNK